jgi:hypothetical protein
MWTSRIISAALFALSLPAVLGQKKDVIMIAIDDMRPELHCYGCDYMHTPNMDALAAESVVMDRMYTGLALCAPSRTIFLTSRRPDTSRVWTISPNQYWRKSGGNFTTLPQTFKDRGYLTIGTGKVLCHLKTCAINQSDLILLLLLLLLLSLLSSRSSTPMDLPTTAMRSTAGHLSLWIPQ